MIKTEPTTLGRLSQGDIIRNVEYIEYVREENGILEISKVVFPLVIVLTQDCDLEQDKNSRTNAAVVNHDKFLLSILVAPLYNVEHVYNGDHLSELDRKMQVINRKRSPGEFLRSNQNPRYHYLDFLPEVKIVPSVIDFKHYFSVDVSQLKLHHDKHFACRASDLFREDISQRFSSFLSRIGLPN